jgi:hypothetical protein
MQHRQVLLEVTWLVQKAEFKQPLHMAMKTQLRADLVVVELAQNFPETMAVVVVVATQVVVVEMEVTHQTLG